MTYDDAVKRWVANTYHLPLPEVEHVNFDVQYAGDTATLHPTFQLEIDVHMTDHTQHLFVRKARDFGTIVEEVLALAS
jgi:hypothetical protein